MTPNKWIYGIQHPEIPYIWDTPIGLSDPVGFPIVALPSQWYPNIIHRSLYMLVREGIGDALDLCLLYSFENQKIYIEQRVAPWVTFVSFPVLHMHFFFVCNSLVQIKMCKIVAIRNKKLQTASLYIKATWPFYTKKIHRKTHWTRHIVCVSFFAFCMHLFFWVHL